MRSSRVVAVAVAGLLLAACGPKNETTTTGTGAPASSAAAAPASPAVKDLTAGNCTLYSKADATALIGAVNMNNKALDIGTDGGTKIDLCSYLDLQGSQSVQGVSYAVVRYDSGDTAFAEVKKVRADMLESAGEHDWPVQALTTQAPGAGPVLGGYGTKTDEGVTYTIAVVGTNVGPYLVVALGASSLGTDDAKRFAVTLFGALSAAVG